MSTATQIAVLPETLPEMPRFVVHHQAFHRILGAQPWSHLVCEAPTDDLPLFHEACVYHPSSKSIFTTSNQIELDSNQSYTATDNKTVKLHRIFDDGTRTKGAARCESVEFPGITGTMLNGGVNASLSNTSAILFCAQGSKSPQDISGIISLQIPTDPSELYPAPQIILDSFHGHPFNSVNDVIVHPLDNSIWFSDPSYGHHQGVRPAPVLPDQIYRFDPAASSVRAMANGFSRPNGLCFSPDLKTLYVTDTGAIHGSSQVPIDLTGPSHLYAFDILERHGEPCLVNQRLFAYAPGRFPDGIKCDTEGNVYSGCGDGIEVWNPAGVQIGTIAVSGGVANFCFGERGVIYACNETKLWKFQLNPESVRGALLGL